MKIKYVLTAASALLVSQASAANIILNGNFETATTTGPAGNIISSELGNFNYVNVSGGYGNIGSAGVSNWTTAGARIWYAIDAGDLLGEGAANNLARLDGNPAGGVDMISQGALSLSSGQTVTLDLTAFAEAGDNTLFANLVSGGTTIDLLGGGSGINIDSTDNATQNVNSGSVAVTTTGTYTLNIWVDQTAGNNHAYVDNISLNAVPEPSSTALLGLGGIALILRRRK